MIKVSRSNVSSQTEMHKERIAHEHPVTRSHGRAPIENEKHAFTSLALRMPTPFRLIPVGAHR